MTYESKVREYYDSAFDCFQAIMGDRWHFGDPQAEANGASPQKACELLEEKLVSLSGLKAGSRAMDFGSGIGGPTLHMAKVSGASFVGVTNNARCTAKARESAAERGLASQVTFMTLEDTGYKNLPFPVGHFDAVSFYDSVCHVPDKAALFREMFRVLAPGGHVVGVDWVQRAFGDCRTEAQIMSFMQPVNDTFVIPWHGTIESYKQMMEDAGFQVTTADDLFEGVKCWGKTADQEHEHWLRYEGPNKELFRSAKQALDGARLAGVFTVGMFVAVKPA